MNSDDDLLPGIDFTTLVMSLSHSALLHLGQTPDPDHHTSGVNLPMAKHAIDLLVVLEEKTKGNLSGEEERLIHQVLYELRLKYVELT